MSKLLECFHLINIPTSKFGNFFRKDKKNYDPTTKIISMPAESIRFHQKGLGSYLYEKMKKYEKNCAQIFAPTEAEHNYSSLLSKSVRASMTLKKRKVNHKHIVCICSLSNKHVAVAFLALVFVGATVALLDPMLGNADLLTLVDDLQPHMVIVDTYNEAMLQNIKDTLNIHMKIVSFAKFQNYECFQDFIEEGAWDSFSPYIPAELTKVAVIIVTSGVTSVPKLVQLNHLYLMYHCRKIMMNQRIYLDLSPLCTFTSLTLFIGAVSTGATRVICPDFNPNLIWEYLQSYNVMLMYVTPCEFIMLVHNDPKITVSSLKFLIINGGCFPVEYVNRAHEIIPYSKILNSYGMAELGLAFNSNHKYIGTALNSVGVPQNDYQYKIVRPGSEKTLGYNESGELRIKTEFCFTDYDNCSSFSHWDNNGFFKTGDIAYFDRNLCFYIVDRTRNVFKFKNQFILPTTLENVIQNHPGVEFVSVVGIPDSKDVNHSMAIVVPMPNSVITSKEVLSFVNQRVEARHKVSVTILVDSLPLTYNRKISRRAVYPK